MLSLGSLCKSMGCCPEHCWDWDSCEWGDCTNWQGFSHHKEIGIKAPKKLLRSGKKCSAFILIASNKYQTYKLIIYKQ